MTFVISEPIVSHSFVVGYIVFQENQKFNLKV